MGAPGPYDTTPDPGASGIEFLVYESTEHFHQHLVEEGIPSYYDNYTFGTHSFPYWARDLRAFMKPMMSTFAHPRTPTTISYLSIDKAWTQWGWSVSLTRTTPQQFSSLQAAGPRGFTLQGSGTALVVTPPNYRPGARMRVRASGSAGSSTQILTVSRTRRLHIALPVSTGSGTGTVTVTIHLAR
jgi:hypothetical protein